MSKMPWIRFFPSDWLAGTRGMSAVETGVYITLVATMYERGEPIPEDNARLARLCGSSNSAFKKALDTLVDEGKITRVDGGLWNDRVEKEQVYLSEKSEVGSKAARARWGKKDNENNTTDDANALPTHSEGNANQKPDTRIDSSSLRSEESAPASSRSKAKSDLDAFKAEISTVLDGDRVEAICAVRRKKGAVFTAHAGKLLVAALSACPNPSSAADEMVLRNWTSVKPEWLSGRHAQAPPAIADDGLARDAQGRVNMADFTSKILEQARQLEHDDGRTIEASYERGTGNRAQQALPLPRTEER